MVFSFFRIAARMAVVFPIVLGFVAAPAAAREIANARGTIAISEVRQGLRAPSCAQLVVEARDALDNHLIAETQAAMDEAGACRYALSVPAQMAVWLRVQPVLVASARVGGAISNAPTAERLRATTGSVALRFTLVAPTTYFFAPSEQKTIPLSY
jgi:hypothetical protein